MSKLVEKLKKNICRYLVDHRKTDLAYMISPSYTTVLMCANFAKGFEEGIENGEMPTKEAFEAIDNLYTNIWGFYGMLDEEDEE